MRKRLFAALAAVLALALIGAGCGDDGPSKEDFVAEANEICADGNLEIQEAFEVLYEGGANPGRAEEAAVVSATLLPNVKKQLHEIDELEAPEGDEEQIDEFIAAGNAAVRKAEGNPGAVPGGPFFDEANRLALDYGLKKCGGE